MGTSTTVIADNKKGRVCVVGVINRKYTLMWSNRAVLIMPRNERTEQAINHFMFIIVYNRCLFYLICWRGIVQWPPDC